MGRENAPFEKSDSVFCFKKKAEQIYTSFFLFKLKIYINHMVVDRLFFHIKVRFRGYFNNYFLKQFNREKRVEANLVGYN
jgi:hypothetical protein